MVGDVQADKWAYFKPRREELQHLEFRLHAAAVEPHPQHPLRREAVTDSEGQKDGARAASLGRGLDIKMTFY